MMDELKLSEIELHYLNLISKGLYEHSISKPPTIIALISKGMIEELTIMVFPLIAPKTLYRPTSLGNQILISQQSRNG
jgi:hypothetical protein